MKQRVKRNVLKQFLLGYKIGCFEIMSLPYTVFGLYILVPEVAFSRGIFPFNRNKKKNLETLSN